VLDTRAPAHTISKQAELLTAVRRISPSGRRQDWHASAASAMVDSLKDQVRRLLAVAPLEAILSTPSSATHATDGAELLIVPVVRHASMRSRPIRYVRASLVASRHTRRCGFFGRDVELAEETLALAIRPCREIQ
jgi:hypothetical protein